MSLYDVENHYLHLRCPLALGKVVGSQYGTAVGHLSSVAWWQVGELSLCTWRVLFGKSKSRCPAVLANSRKR